MKLEHGDIRGASIWLDNEIPFALVNQNDVESAAGRVFTLLHEYAHLIVRKGGLVCDFRGRSKKQNPEPFANRFAARMLISYQELESRLIELDLLSKREFWSDEVLDKIRKPFFVSRDVVVITLQELDLAPRDFYQKRRALWEKRKPGGRGKGGRPTDSELAFRRIGYSLGRVLSTKPANSLLPLTDLSYVLDMKVERIDGFFSWMRGELSQKV